MITVTLNRTEFEYDIHSLIKAFFPKEDVELYYTKEAHADEKNVACTNHSAEQEEAGSSHFSIDYADDRISIAWDDAPDGPALRTFAVDFSNRTETKNALKEHLYRLLEEETGQPLPWGTLTGIRPTKIPMQMLDEGKTKEEIASYMKQTYLASDEKINLSIAIAERERALLSRLDYKNGYSLYIGIPFCPSTCLYCSFTSYPLTGAGRRRNRKRVAAMLSNLETGDCVLTTSGFYGIVIDITDDTVIVEFGNNKNCRIPMEKSAISKVEKAGEN